MVRGERRLHLIGQPYTANIGFASLSNISVLLRYFLESLFCYRRNNQPGIFGFSRPHLFGHIRSYLVQALDFVHLLVQNVNFEAASGACRGLGGTGPFFLEGGHFFAQPLSDGSIVVFSGAGSCRGLPLTRLDASNSITSSGSRPTSSATAYIAPSSSAASSVGCCGACCAPSSSAADIAHPPPRLVILTLDLILKVSGGLDVKLPNPATIGAALLSRS